MKELLVVVNFEKSSVTRFVNKEEIQEEENEKFAIRAICVLIKARRIGSNFLLFAVLAKKKGEGGKGKGTFETNRRKSWMIKKD